MLLLRFHDRLYQKLLVAQMENAGKFENSFFSTVNQVVKNLCYRLSHKSLFENSLFYLRKKQYTKFAFEILSNNISRTFSNINSTAKSSTVTVQC